MLDAWRRGTALCSASLDFDGGPSRHGGAPNPHDRPLQFSNNGTDPDAIGAYDAVDGLTFLDFGGWDPASAFCRGDADYLVRAFSELSAAMNVEEAWKLIEGDPHLPHMWVPQPVNPTVYAEIEWAGMYTDWSDAFGLGDFPVLPGGDDGFAPLDHMLALTYYYLYPMRDLPPDPDSSRRFEGQWEAISLFFAGDPGSIGASGRPRSFVFHEPPEFVVISKGIERAETATLRQHPNEVRRWSDVEVEHAHPVIYVTAGTHRHSFVPLPGTRWDPSANPPPGEAVLGGPGEFPGVETLLLWAAVAGAAATILAALRSRGARRDAGAPRVAVHAGVAHQPHLGRRQPRVR